MTRLAIAFFITGILFQILGLAEFGGITYDIGETLLSIFLILSSLFFAASLLSEKANQSSPTA